MPLKLNSSGGGSVTLDTPSTASNLTFTLPSATSKAAYADSSDNLQVNSGYGSYATGYVARAWVDFNGQSTVTIRASGNVSSITDHGTGDYTVNFSTTLTDQNFALAGSAGSKDFDGVDNGVVCLANRSSSTVRIYTRNVQSSGSTTDYDAVNVAIFR